ncbi:hypothetical protein [Prescottella agglutinans]|uniref:Uncharacterized protein n=1 Tax=Prescottella agglutinans TaxID=1644129 RepID=A0ABT6M671_9NOCA|nr:hypothetical protein [Prescottella agglutinans]MDH6279807.1 hypothetical protein [Prescottella agglutinans]
MPAHRATTIALHIALGAVVISTIIPASLVLFADATVPSWIAPTQLLTASALLTILARRERRTRHD